MGGSGPSHGAEADGAAIHSQEVSPLFFRLTPAAPAEAGFRMTRVAVGAEADSSAAADLPEEEAQVEIGKKHSPIVAAITQAESTTTGEIRVHLTAIGGKEMLTAELASFLDDSEWIALRSEMRFCSM